MSMTFLQLAQRLRQEVSGVGTGPNLVTNQVGEYKRIVDWIATADEDVQRKHNEWLFMRPGFTVSTVAADPIYAYGDCTDTTTNLPITNFRKWVEDSFKIYLLSGGVQGETPLSYMSYDRWYSIYFTGTRVSSYPIDFTVKNDLTFSLAPIPNDVYVVSGEYQRSVTTLTNGSDTPIYPAEYHMLPVYAGMMSYGRYTGAVEVYQDGDRLYKRMMAEMERTQLPEMLLGATLV